MRVPRGDLSTLLAILRKFTWAIPSDTRRNIIPDVSLYDHLKTTAAITACLMRRDKGAESPLSRTVSRNNSASRSKCLSSKFGSSSSKAEGR